jgi:hypothetical protein
MAVNGSLPAGTVTEGEGGVGHGSALLLSAAERQFVTKGVEEGVRPDGRERLASRAIQIETGVIPGAFGSAQARAHRVCSCFSPDLGAGAFAHSYKHPLTPAFSH